MLEVSTIHVFVLDSSFALCIPVFCSGAFSSQFGNLQVLNKVIFFMFCCQISVFHLYSSPWGNKIARLSCSRFELSRKGQKVIYFFPHGALRKDWRRTTFPGYSTYWAREWKKEIFSFSVVSNLWTLMPSGSRQRGCVYDSVYSHSSTSFYTSPGSSVFVTHFCVRICFKSECSGWGLSAGLHPFVSHCLHWECFENIAHPFPGRFGVSLAGWSSCWEKGG